GPWSEQTELRPRSAKDQRIVVLVMARPRPAPSVWPDHGPWKRALRSCTQFVRYGMTGGGLIGWWYMRICFSSRPC
ncbi:hypothetical protein J6590_104843, partial [Homalodisca vitripennis]